MRKKGHETKASPIPGAAACAWYRAEDKRREQSTNQVHVTLPGTAPGMG